METTRNLKPTLILISTCLIMSLFWPGCKTSNNAPNVKMTLTDITFECYHQSDQNNLKPHAMYFEVYVKNVGDSPLFFSTYNHQFDQENKKYGYFQLIVGTDTLPLFSRYDALYEIDPNLSLNFQLSYEGDFLKKFVIKDPDDVEAIKSLLGNVKLCFVPLNGDNNSVNMISSVFCDIKTDSYILSYFKEGVTSLNLYYDAHRWKEELPLDWPPVEV